LQGDFKINANLAMLRQNVMSFGIKTNKRI